MITRDAIVQRFIAECRTSQTNQEAVDKVDAWLKAEIMKLDGVAADRLRGEANHAGAAILMLVRCSEAKGSSSVPSGEAMGTPGITQTAPKVGS